MQYTRQLCLGDSITFGARCRFGQTYPAILEQHLVALDVPSVFINAGVNGERSYEIVERGWQHLGTDGWIRTCIAMMGTNDSKPASRTPHGMYIDQWDRLLRRCLCTDTRLIAVEMPYLDATGQPEYDAASVEWIAQANRKVAAWSSEHDVIYVGDIFDTFRRPGMLDDGVHPTNVGNLHIASQLVAVLSQPMPAPLAAVDAPPEFVTGDFVPAADTDWLGGPR